MAIKHLSFRVTGRVQGVFFRKSTQEKAEELTLSGNVKNLDDGSVSVHAEGEMEKLQTLEDWLSVGPPQARVDHLYKEEKALEHFEDFQVIR